MATSIRSRGKRAALNAHRSWASGSCSSRSAERESCSGGRGHRSDLPVDLCGEPLLRLFEIEVDLQPQPKPLGGSKVSSQAKGRLGRDRPLCEHDFVDSPRRDLDLACQPVLADPQRLQELIEKDLAGMDVGELLAHRTLVSGNPIPGGGGAAPPHHPTAAASASASSPSRRWYPCFSIS